MENGVIESGVTCEACAECKIVCRTADGKDLLHNVPRFLKIVTEHSTASCTNSVLQVPAPYIRNHMDTSEKEIYVLEGALGSAWPVTFDTAAFKHGWKEFSIDYQLEKGDGIMLSLVAPRRFYVNVFDKFGMEKLSTKQPTNSRACPTNKDYQVSNSRSGGGGAEDQYNPLGSGNYVHQDGNFNGTPHLTLCAACARSSGPNRNLDCRTSFKDNDQLFPNQAVGHEAEPSTVCQPFYDSEDSIQVRLANAVIAKAREKKLKWRKATCTSTPHAKEGINTQKDGTTEETEACQNKDRAIGTTNVDPTDSHLRKDGIRESRCDAMSENPSEELRDSSSILPPSIIGVTIKASAISVEEKNDIQADSLLEIPLQEAPLTHQRPEIAIGEGGPSRRVLSNNSAGDRPPPLLMPSLVKVDPELSFHEPRGKCSQFGLRNILKSPDRSILPKSEPVATDRPSLCFRTPEVSSPSFNIHPVTEYQKQRAQAAAAKLSDNTKVPSALVIMRCSMRKSFDCFLSVMCSEMLPSVPTEITLMDTEGNAEGVNWIPDQRIMNGPGWKRFVNSHNLQIDDFWVMEVVDPSEHDFVVKAHIFHSHEMESTPERQPRPVPAASFLTGPSKMPAIAVKTRPGPGKTSAVQAKTPAIQRKTSAVQGKTPAIQAKAPPVQAKAPPVQAKAPPVQAKAPPVQAKAPAVQAKAPAVQAKAPAVQATAPAVQATAPAVQATAPAVQATAPAVQAKAPGVQAKAPAVQGRTPAVQAKAPAVQAKAPAVQAKAPVFQGLASAGQAEAPAVQGGVTAQAKSPAVPAKTRAISAVQALLSVQETPAHVLGTKAKTRSSNQLHSPYKLTKRKRPPNMEESAVQTQSPGPGDIPRLAATNFTEDGRAVIELTKTLPLKRLRRGSLSSSYTQGTERDSTPTLGTGEEPSHSLLKPVAAKVKQQATRQISLYTRHLQRKAKTDAAAAAAAIRRDASHSVNKVQLRSSSMDKLTNSKQVRNRISQKTLYEVSKVIDRRKSLQGVVFLVELTDRVSSEIIHKKMKAVQDEKGRWWVPHHHFNHSLSSCYLE